MQREYRQARGGVIESEVEENVCRDSAKAKVKNVPRDGVAGVVQPHGHVNQLIMHEGQIKSAASAAIDRGTLSHVHAKILCCLPGIITVVIVRSPAQIRDGRAASAHLRVPPIPSHRCC